MSVVNLLVLINYHIGSKVKYMERKQNREAARGDGGSAAAATGSQVPPQEPNRGRQGAERDNTTPPQLRGQQGAP